MQLALTLRANNEQEFELLGELLEELELAEETNSKSQVHHINNALADYLNKRSKEHLS